MPYTDAWSSKAFTTGDQNVGGEQHFGRKRDASNVRCMSLYPAVFQHRTVSRYNNEKAALQALGDSPCMPNIFVDAFLPAHHIHPKALVLVMEWRTGARIRTCWPVMMQAERSLVRSAILEFLRTSLRQGIYHDDLRHLRNVLWDSEKDTLTILDFELVGISWQGDRLSTEVDRLAEQETALIIAQADQLL
ncbi:hypothetical protein OPT61_g9614 [Boeremia exigua]|uniref:Uncharacterized protein n=1 Tax=Boeremia exigua TaxID=749465 RepID=A0ACC2HTC8_9PLEO|nr:hypothetical protein OPT61_g9614 [Boeremia exigua]